MNEGREKSKYVSGKERRKVRTESRQEGREKERERQIIME